MTFRMFRLGLSLWIYPEGLFEAPVAPAPLACRRKYIPHPLFQRNAEIVRRVMQAYVDGTGREMRALWSEPTLTAVLGPHGQRARRDILNAGRAQTLLRRLHKDPGAGLQKIDAVLEYLSAIWPQGCPWPVGIQKPGHGYCRYYQWPAQKVDAA